MAVRLKLVCKSFEFLADALASPTSPMPRLYRRARARLQLGVFDDVELVDMTTVDHILVEFRPARDKNTAPGPAIQAVYSATFDEFDNSLDATSWDDGSKQHLEISLSADDTNIPAGFYWLYIAGYTTGSDEPIVLGDGPFEFVEAAGPDTNADVVGFQCTLEGVTQIPNNGSSGLGDVPVNKFKNGLDYGILCPDAASDSNLVVKQFWYVKNTTEADVPGYIQSGPDTDNDTNPYKWVRAL